MKFSRRNFLHTLFAASQATIGVRFLPENLQVPCSSLNAVLLPNADQSSEPPVYLYPKVSSDNVTSPQIDCPAINYAGWRSWQDVGAAMGHAPSCSMHQHWLPQAEPALKPATVALAHHDTNLIVYAELSDVDIFNTVTENHVHAYNHGDVFEMFLRAANEENYLEHHITPDNCVLQLRYPHTKIMEEIGARKHPDWQTKYASNIPVPSRVLVQPKLSLWRILAIAPLGVIASHPREEIDRDWRFSFSRYDHSHGTKAPVLSSTSAHATCNFHEHASWGKLRLV